MAEEEAQRRRKILSILEQEIKDGEEVAARVKAMAERLLIGEKGYLPEDIERDVVFDVSLGHETAKSSADLLVSVDGRRGMVIKCAPGSITSRERQAVAAARLLGSPPVPVAVVMDPLTAVVLNAVTGKVFGEGFGAIPSKEEMRGLLSGMELKPLAPERIEKEKRILLAFDAIRCSIPQGGADGGVQIGEPCEE